MIADRGPRVGESDVSDGRVESRCCCGLFPVGGKGVRENEEIMQNHLDHRR